MTLILHVLLKGLPEQLREKVREQKLLLRLNEGTIITFDEETSDVKEDGQGLRIFTQRYVDDVSIITIIIEITKLKSKK